MEYLDSFCIGVGECAERRAGVEHGGRADGEYGCSVNTTLDVLPALTLTVADSIIRRRLPLDTTAVLTRVARSGEKNKKA